MLSLRKLVHTARPKMGKSMLAAFDFDHTIVDKNSDIVVRDLVPKRDLTKSIESLHRSDGWTMYMQAIFDLLVKNGIGEERVRSAVEAIPEVEGMSDLLRGLHDDGWDIIIISDSNSYFIQCWLDANKLDHTVTKVFTNPGTYINGRLKIQKYHVQNWCKLSTENLCKGHILEGYSTGKDFKRIAYVGDGDNDFCPALKLKSKDFLFPREGYSLEKILNNPLERKRVSAMVHTWSSPNQILEKLRALAPET